MKTEDALNRHFAETGIYAEGCTRDDWYPNHLVYLQSGGGKIPILPILRRHGPVVLHDVHHMLTGYPPTWTGEAAIAGWELGSGGCGWHPLYWLDRLSFFVGGLLTAPVATLRGLRRGLRCRNLYRMRPEAVLAEDVDTVRARVLRTEHAELPPTP
jgi:hypothetical protein